ncbi:heme-binding Shp domain-containing protein [Robinsoniella peoriensis]|uniref:heme-binding Shp domain-containing protein n=1 Tax=Robinsoniella peoriensis TaxID=180332 RepID=UPI00375119EC
MKKYLKRLIAVLAAAAVAAGSAGSVMPVQAAMANGVYTAVVHPSYSHPVSGEIEDSGGESSQVLGQSMVESVLYTQALLEVDESGNTYANVRYFLADQISDVQFAVQEWGDSNWMSTDGSVMQENAGGTYCTDYRILLTFETTVVRSTFYVEPMGRYVIFYYYFTDLTEGNNTDFIQSVTVTNDIQAPETQAPETQAAAPQTPAPQAEPQTASSQETPQTTPQTTAPQTESQKETAAAPTAAPVTEASNQTGQKKKKEKQDNSKSDNPLDDAVGLSASKPIAASEEESEEETALRKDNEDRTVGAGSSSGDMGQMVKLTIVTVVAGVVTGVVLMAAAGGILYVIYKRSKEEDDD